LEKGVKMSVASETCYVPTLRWLTGERRALQSGLTQNVKARIKPLIEIPPRAEKHDEPSDRDELMGAESPEAFISLLPQNLIHHWGLSPFMIDTAFLDATEREYQGRSSLAYLCEQILEKNGIPVPIIRIDVSDTHINELRQYVPHGVGLRLTVNDLAFAPIDTILEKIGVGVEQADVIVDLGVITRESAEITKAYLRQGEFPSFSSGREWRSVTLLAGAFPTSLAGMQPGLHTAHRTEWRLWLDLIHRINRRLLFGDYTVNYAAPKKMTSDIRQAIPCIRYTSDEEWLLFRGAGKKDAAAGGNRQYHELARRCRSHEAFRGRTYSEGDRYIDDCANEDDGPGNPTVWRRVASSAHITYVANQCATAYDSAGGLSP